MQTQNLINTKQPIKKSAYIEKLLIAKTVNQSSVFAVTHAGSFIPLRVGALDKVISEAEHCAAHFGLPVEHDLTPTLEVCVNRYKRVGLAWCWVGREKLTYVDANQAYLQLRKQFFATTDDAVVVEDADTRKVLTSSQDCTKWATVLHRLTHTGRVPANMVKGKCAQCFSEFVKLIEEGEFQLCLNCGYEQTRA